MLVVHCCLLMFGVLVFWCFGVLVFVVRGDDYKGITVLAKRLKIMSGDRCFLGRVLMMMPGEYQTHVPTLGVEMSQ